MSSRASRTSISSTADTATIDAFPGPGAVLEVDLEAIAANWRALCTLHPSGPVGAVLKADAYGLGAARVGAHLHRAGCRRFFVATLQEALSLRPLLPASMLAVLAGPVAGEEPVYADQDITPVLCSLAQIAAWRALAASQHRVLSAVLHLDTGMSRLGLEPDEVSALAGNHRLLDGIDLRAIMTHLVASEIPDDPNNARQAREFAAACDRLPRAPRSLANSSGIFLGALTASDLARPGAALYGINPTPSQPNPMRPVVRLRARVLQVRNIPASATVGYNGVWRAAQPSRIATASIGYADGWHRSLGNAGFGVFDGRAVPLVGRVSMDLTTFDVTDTPVIAPGDWVELMGPARTVDQVAEAAGTNGYEVLTSLGPRIGRIYRPA